MKNIKKIIMVLLVAVLSLCGLTNVNAAGNGKITVNNAVAGKTYEIYKIFDLTYTGTGTNAKVAYTIDSDWEAFFTGAGASYLTDQDKDENGIALNPITIGSTKKYINITEDNVADFTQAALAYATKLDGNDGSQVAGEGSTTVTFENLDLGYYLVYPQGATDIEGEDENGKPYASICSITSTLPEATVNVKAKAPEIDKVVDKNNVDVGDEVTFTIKGQVPDTTGYDSYTYNITDTMTAGLTFVKEVNVTFGTTPIEVTPSYSNNGFEINFDMTDYQDYKGQTITVTYKAIINENAVTDDETKNTAVLKYSNNPKVEDSYDTFTDEEIVYSSQLKVLKVDAKDNSIELKGAKFVVKNSEGKYYVAYTLDDEGNRTVMTNVSSTNGLVDVEWIDEDDADLKNYTNITLLETDETGVILFKGIKNGEYSLVEVAAPEGYNKLTGPVTVKVGYNEEGTTLLETNVSHEEKVENSTGTQLPSTGGVGTTMFIIIGSLLMIGSLLVLITNKRMSKESL